MFFTPQHSRGGWQAVRDSQGNLPPNAGANQQSYYNLWRCFTSRHATKAALQEMLERAPKTTRTHTYRPGPAYPPTTTKVCGGG